MSDVKLHAAGALANPKIREMLERFRAEGPTALEQYATDPSVVAVMGAISAARGSDPLAPSPSMSNSNQTPLIDYKQDDDDDDDDKDDDPISLLSAANDTNLTSSFPVRSSALDMMMKLDGDALNAADKDVRNSLGSLSQGPIVVSSFIVDSDNAEPQYLSDLRRKAGIEWPEGEIIDGGYTGDRPLRLVIGVGDGESVSILSKIINKCRGADCRVKVLVGRGCLRRLSAAIDDDVLGWAAIGSTCTRERMPRGLLPPQIQFFKVEDDYSGGSKFPIHEKLADWADACLILPMDAAMLASSSLGHFGDQTSSQGCLILRLLRCWDPSKQVLVGLDLPNRQARSPITNVHVGNLSKLLPFIHFIPNQVQGGAFDLSSPQHLRAQYVLELLSTVTGGFTWCLKPEEEGEDVPGEEAGEGSWFGQGIRRRKGDPPF